MVRRDFPLFDYFGNRPWFLRPDYLSGLSDGARARHGRWGHSEFQTPFLFFYVWRITNEISTKRRLNDLTNHGQARGSSSGISWTRSGRRWRPSRRRTARAPGSSGCSTASAGGAREARLPCQFRNIFANIFGVPLLRRQCDRNLGTRRLRSRRGCTSRRSGWIWLCWRSCDCVTIRGHARREATAGSLHSHGA